MEIRWLARQEIDKVKWNSCIHYANNGNVFGYLWYLDHVAKEWDALVEGDYESVFPLVWRKHWLRGKELYQPAWMRELGLYSIHVLSTARQKAFLEAIPPEYGQVDIALNEQNLSPAVEPFRLETRSNFQLLLDRPYEEIAEGFSRDLFLTLERAERSGLRSTSGLSPERIAEFYRRNGQGKQRESRSHALLRIMYNALHRGWGFSTGVTDENGELLAVDFFLYSHSKAVSLTPVCSARGLDLGAPEHLCHAIVRSHAGRPLILDFNTADGRVPRAFGAQENEFYHLRRDSRILGVF